MQKVLIIEDEENILMALEDDFSIEGFQVTSCRNGKEGLDFALRSNYNIIILDVMLPDLNGFEVCKKIRQANINTPIIILSAKGQEIDKILGLELGADDYVTKPFSPRELQSRVRALLRRTGSNSRTDTETITLGNVSVDLAGFEVYKRGQKLKLTSHEFLLLKFLFENKNVSLSREAIMKGVWGHDTLVSSRTIDTHIANLRAKLEDDPHNPKMIKSLRNVGYMLIDKDLNKT